MPTGDESLGTSLRLARDLCFGVGAFAASTSGALRAELLPDAAIPSLPTRVAALAQACLANPAAQGDEPFWTAESPDEAGTHAESLACVAMPLRHEAGLVGVLGVVDGWLPELDDEQRRGLASIAGTVAPLVADLPADAGPGRRPGADVAPPRAPLAASPPRELPRPLLHRPAPEPIPPRSLTDAPAPAAVRDPSPAPVEPEVPAPAAHTPLFPAEPVRLAPTPVAAPVEAPPLPAPPVAPVSAPSPASSPAAKAGADQFLAEVVDHHPDGMVVVLEDGTILFANQTLVHLSGLEADEVVGADIGGLVMTDADQPLGSNEVAASLVGIGAPGRRLWLSSASGTDVAVDVVGTAFYSHSAAGTCYVGAVRPAAPSAVPAPANGFPALDPAVVASSATGPVIPNEGALNALLNALEEGIVVCDHNGVVLVANLASKVLQGISPATELVGLAFPTQTALRSSDGGPLPTADHPVFRAMRGTVVDAEQLVIERTEGERRFLVASARPFLLPDGNGALMVLRDVTAQHKDEEWLTHLALHDALTGLANRYLLVDHLGRMLSDVRSRGGSVALVYLDLDDFKNINDRYGHDVGDEVLVALGRRLEGTVRSTDICSRIGGDEFVIAHTATADPEDIELVVSRIRKTLAEPYKVRGDVLYVGASIGWVTADPVADDPKSLLVQADQEMYRHKNARRRAQS